jgi:DNA-binding response OmpR family regulator
MPGVDGLQVCRSLREKALAAGHDFPVWIVTGARSREAELAAIQAGARAMIGKPFEWAEFQAMLEREFAPRPAGTPPPPPNPAAPTA